MFQFADTALLFSWIAIPAVLLLLWLSGRARRRAIDALGDRTVVERLMRSVNGAGRRWRSVMIVLALTLAVTALARPQFGSRVETVQREGQDIVIAMDVSASMLAEDLTPNRLERARFAVNGLIDRLRGDRIAIVAFAGEAFVQSPLTVDYAAAKMFLNSISPDIIPVPGTNLAEAMDVSLGAFAQDVQQHRILILITDGEDHEGDFQERIDAAQEAGVTVYTVGLGSTAGVPIPTFDAAGRRTGFKRDRNGNVVTTRLDEETLRQIAGGTGGRYIHAVTGDELNALAGEIEQMEGREFEARQVTQFEEQYQIFLGLALALLIAEVLVPDRKKSRHEWTGRFS